MRLKKGLCDLSRLLLDIYFEVKAMDLSLYVQCLAVEDHHFLKLTALFVFCFFLQASDGAQRKQSTYAPPTMKGKNTTIFSPMSEKMLSARSLPEERIMRRIYLVHLRSLCNLLF